MPSRTDRSSCGSVLRVLHYGCTLSTIAFYALVFILICDPLTRVRNVNRDFQPPGNGHLTDSMSPLVRNALSWKPEDVIGLQMGLVFACAIVYAGYCLWCNAMEYECSIVAAVVEAFQGAAGVLPGLMGIYTFNWWGCRMLFYGQDPENTTENTYGDNACNEYRGATYLFTIAGCLWLLGLFFHIVHGFYGLGRRVVKTDDIELNRTFRVRQERRVPEAPPAYTSGDYRRKC